MAITEGLLKVFFLELNGDRIDLQIGTSETSINQEMFLLEKRTKFSPFSRYECTHSKTIWNYEPAN